MIRIRPIATVKDNYQLIVGAERRSQSALTGMKVVHRDDQFARIGIRLRGIAIELEPQIDASEIHPPRIGIHDGVRERPLPTVGNPTGYERLPVDVHPRS